MPETTTPIAQLIAESRNPDALVILRSAHDMPCTKQFIKGADGSISVVPYPGETHWIPEVLPCRDFTSFCEALKVLSRTTNRIVIRDALRDDVTTFPVRRKGAGEGAAFQQQARSWVALDIDGFVLPERAIHDTAPDRIAQLMPYMPPMFKGAACFYHFTSSYGVLHPRNVMRVRLWYLLSHPVSSAAWKRVLKPYAAALKLDLSFYDSVRPYYIAAPIFRNMEDPMSRDRTGGANAH